MRARVDRFTREQALPSVSQFVIAALAAYMERLIALRGEAYAEIPTALRREHIIKRRG